MLTMIKPGIMRVVKGTEETDLAVTGGFFEIKDDRVTVLADSAERAEEIDTARAEEARRRAEHALQEKVSTQDLSRPQPPSSAPSCSSRPPNAATTAPAPAHPPAPARPALSPPAPPAAPASPEGGGRSRLPRE